MWEDSPIMAKELPRSATGGIDRDRFTTLEMKFASADMSLVGAGSESNVKSDPVTYLVLDESEEIDLKTITQAEDRVKGRKRYLILKSSTPGSEPSDIVAEYKRGTAEVYQIPDPTTGEYFEMRWRIGTDDVPDYRIKCDRAELLGADEENEESIEEIEKHSYYLPDIPGAQPIYDEQKAELLERGKWVSTNPNPEPFHYSFHLPSQYSNYITFGKMLNQFARANGDPDLLYGFVTGWLAESWKEKVLPMDTGKLKKCEGDYDRGEKKGTDIVMVVDVQRIDLRINVRGYDQKGEYLIEWGTKAAWEDCDRLQEKYGIDHVGVDCQYPDRTQEVFEAVAERKDNGWFALEGKSSKDLTKPFSVQRISPFVGKRHKYTMTGKITYVAINSEIWKGELAKRRNGQVPSWKIYRNIDRGYVKELFGEYQAEQIVKGKPTVVWKLKSHRQNHQFDLEYYQLAIAAWLNLGSRKGVGPIFTPSQHSGYGEMEEEARLMNSDEGYRESQPAERKKESPPEQYVPISKRRRLAGQ